MLQRIYLDHNATTRPDPAVVAEMLPCLESLFGNPSSSHQFGQDAKRVIEQARQRLAALIGAASEEVIFTSGGSEANNHAIRGVAEARAGRGRHIITAVIEHPAVLNPCRRLEAAGYRVTYLPVDAECRVAPAAVAAAITPQTVLVTVMLANNDVGTLQPLREIAEIAHARGVPVHTDAVQALGKIPVDVKELGVDLLSLSAHKFNGPKGVGALYRRRDLELAPLILGGGHERRQRAGTENVPGIAGCGKGCELAAARLSEMGGRVRALRDRLAHAILEQIPGTSANGTLTGALPNTLSICFDGVNGGHLAMNLDVQGIAVATASACATTEKSPSHVLLAMGHSREQALASLRFSLGLDNTAAEIERTIAVLAQLVPVLRGKR